MLMTAVSRDIWHSISVTSNITNANEMPQGYHATNTALVQLQFTDLKMQKMYQKQTYNTKYLLSIISD
jgi:hypothetical protein